MNIKFLYINGRANNICLALLNEYQHTALGNEYISNSLKIPSVSNIVGNIKRNLEW